MKDDHRAIKSVITGRAIPKSVGLIELEKNYALVADLLGHLLDRLEKIERHVESLEKKFISTRIKSATESRKKKRKTR